MLYNKKLQGNIAKLSQRRLPNRQSQSENIDNCFYRASKPDSVTPGSHRSSFNDFSTPNFSPFPISFYVAKCL